MGTEKEIFIKALEEENRKLNQLLRQEKEKKNADYERLQVISNNIPNGTLYRSRLDKKTGKRNMIYVGEKWEEVTGIPSNTPLTDIYDAFISHIDPEHLSLVKAKILESTKNMSAINCEFSLNINGQLRWLQMSSQPHEDDETVFWDGIVMDITTRKIIAQNLEKEHERLQKHSNNIPNGTLFRFELHKVNGQSAITYVGARWEEVVGIPAHLALTDTDGALQKILYEPKMFIDFKEKIKESANNLSVFNYELKVKNNGKSRWIQIRSQPHMEGNTICWDGAMIDITHSKQTEHQLIAEKRRLEKISNNIPDGTLYQFVFNSETGEMYMTYLGSRWEIITGVSVEKTMEDVNNVFASVHPDDLPGLIQGIKESARTKTDFIDDIRLKSENSEQWVKLLSSPIEDGNLVIWDGFILDITQSKEVEKTLIEQREAQFVMIEELSRAKDKAEESERLKSAFLANVTHEVRTPLSGIIGLLNLLLKNENLSDKTKETINLINNNSEHVLTMINDILDEAKIESGQLNIQPEPFEIDKLIDETHSFFELFLKKKYKENISLIAEKDEKISNQPVMVDPVRLKQIIYNLISNAVKFTDKGYINFGYRLTADNMLEFWVEDTGIGIPENQIDVVFRRFRQVERNDSKNYGGTGLGLTISRNLVKLMGGDMTFTSTEGLGTTFSFTIPYLPCTK